MSHYSRSPGPDGREGGQTPPRQSLDNVTFRRGSSQTYASAPPDYMARASLGYGARPMYSENVGNTVVDPDTSRLPPRSAPTRSTLFSQRRLSRRFTPAIKNVLGMNPFQTPRDTPQDPRGSPPMSSSHEDRLSNMEESLQDLRDAMAQLTQAFSSGLPRPPTEGSPRPTAGPPSPTPASEPPRSTASSQDHDPAIDPTSDYDLDAELDDVLNAPGPDDHTTRDREPEPVRHIPGLGHSTLQEAGRLARTYFAPNLHHFQCQSVDWLSYHPKGPYGGTFHHIPKLSARLLDDSQTGFFQFYLSLRQFLSQYQFHPDLLPELSCLHHEVILSACPVGEPTNPLARQLPNMDSLSLHRDHHRLGTALGAAFNSAGKDGTPLIADSAPIAKSFLQQIAHSGDGWVVLQALLVQHHPKIKNTRAPAYTKVLTQRPTMHDADSIVLYASEFTTWANKIALYDEIDAVMPISFPRWFTEGIHKTVQPLIQDIYTDILHFQRDHSGHAYRLTPVPPELSINVIVDRITMLRPTNITPTLPKGSHVSAIVPGPPTPLPNDTHTFLGCVTISANDVSNGVADFYDEIPNGVVSSIPRGRVHLRRKEESVPCPHSPCGGRKHPPNACCICGNAHKVTSCWWLDQRLPDARQQRCDAFRNLKSCNDGPWKSPPDGTIAAVDHGNAPPPTKKLEISPKLQQKLDIREAKALHKLDDDVKDIRDETLALESAYSGIMMQDEVAKLQGVSSIDHYPIPELPAFPIISNIDAPRISDLPVPSLSGADVPAELQEMISPHDTQIPITNPMDEPMIAPPVDHLWFHVDTGATVCVDHRMSTLLNPLPVSGSCGTAGKHDSHSVTALGTWHLELDSPTGDTFSQVIPNVMCVPSFRRRTLSIHVLQDLGYEGEILFRHSGNQLHLKRLSDGRSFSFPLHTHNKTDYVAMKLILKPYPTHLHGQVRSVDLLSSLRDAPMYHIMHLRGGCIPDEALKLWSEPNGFKDVPPFSIPKEPHNCPICLTYKSKAVKSNPRKDQSITTKGILFHVDFSFVSTVSIRGFTCFLGIAEAKTSHRWVFLRQSRKAPLSLLLWFIIWVRKVNLCACNVMRVDGDSALWGCTAIIKALAVIHCRLEPTGGYNSAANGKIETFFSPLKSTMKCLLYMGGRSTEEWCFAILYACHLLSIRPRPSYGKLSTSQAFYAITPQVGPIRIYGSHLYTTHHRKHKSAGSSDIGEMHIFQGLQGTGRVHVSLDRRERVRYTHHCVIDELQVAISPEHRSPAARYLHGLDTPTNYSKALLNHIHNLEITHERWSHENLTQVLIPDISNLTCLGLIYVYNPEVGCCRLMSFQPESAAAQYVPHSLIGSYILEINGIKTRTYDEIQTVVHQQLSLSQGLTGITLLFGTLDPKHDKPDYLEFTGLEHGITRAVWSIMAPEDLTLPAFMGFVTSIMGYKDHALHCPRNWREAMKGNFQPAWKESLFKFLDKCRSYGTFGMPVIPPSNSRIIDAVIALAHKLDEYNRIKDRKTRVCTNGSQQVEGVDFSESYAPTLLSSSLRIIVALAAHFHWTGVRLYHIDVSNAFQGTPPKDYEDRPQYLRCFPEYLEWFSSRYPMIWDKHEDTLKSVPVHQLAMEMFTHVQGRVDASRVFGELISAVITEEMKFISNRADTCFYSGCYKGSIVLMGRSTDDMLLCSNEETYHFVADILRRHWSEIHAKGLATFFFGIRLIQSDDCISMDQRHLSIEVVTKVLGPDWEKHPKSTRRRTVMPAGSAFEAQLASSTPLTKDQTIEAEKKFGFKFRSILCAMMHLSLWTRVDLLPGNVRLAQYQTNTSELHFQVLKDMVLYLRDNLDTPLVYKCMPKPLHPQPSVNAVWTELLRPPNITHSIAKPADSIGEHFACSTCTLDQEGRPYHPLSNIDNHSSLMATISAIDLGHTSAKHTGKTTPGVIVTDSHLLRSPNIDGHVDAMFGPDTFDKSSFGGGEISINGTVVLYRSSKQNTMAHNSTEAEILEGFTHGKATAWIHALLTDAGIPPHRPVTIQYRHNATSLLSGTPRSLSHPTISQTDIDGGLSIPVETKDAYIFVNRRAPITIGEDNRATRTVAHSGKVHRNIRHLTFQTAGLQKLVELNIISMNSVSTKLNRADHLTKILPGPQALDHVKHMMGHRFLTKRHLEITALRNRQK